MIDRAALERLQEWGGPKLVREMVRLFLDNSSERVGQIRSGLEENRLEVAERAAHSLKSSAANVGAMSVSRLAQRIEDLAEKGAGDEARGLFPELSEAHEQACRGLEEFGE